MPIFKHCIRCGRRIPEGTSCPCMDAYKKDRDKDYDLHRRDKKSTDFYNDGRWKATRRYILDLDGNIDVYLYMTTGEIKVADTVHHIIPLKDDWSKRYRDDNLMSLHHDTHSMIEDRYKKDKAAVMTELQRLHLRYRLTQGAVEKV